MDWNQMDRVRREFPKCLSFYGKGIVNQITKTENNPKSQTLVDLRTTLKNDIKTPQIIDTTKSKNCEETTLKRNGVQITVGIESTPKEKTVKFCLPVKSIAIQTEEKVDQLPDTNTSNESNSSMKKSYQLRNCCAIM